MYINKFCYTSMIKLEKSIQNISVMTDEGPDPILALVEGGSIVNIAS